MACAIWIGAGRQLKAMVSRCVWLPDSMSDGTKQPQTSKAKRFRQLLATCCGDMLVDVNWEWGLKVVSVNDDGVGGQRSYLDRIFSFSSSLSTTSTAGAGGGEYRSQSSSSSLSTLLRFSSTDAASPTPAGTGSGRNRFLVWLGSDDEGGIERADFGGSDGGDGGCWKSSSNSRSSWRWYEFDSSNSSSEGSGMSISISISIFSAILDGAASVLCSESCDVETGVKGRRGDCVFGGKDNKSRATKSL
nr:hypothetical protein Iba_chr12aCG5500 [Ipomoea batatas]